MSGKVVKSSRQVSQACTFLLQAELAARRKTVQSLPRMWQLLDVISLLPAAAKKIRDPAFMYKGTFSRQGSDATFTMPEPLTPIPVDPPCMPSLRPIQPPRANAQAVSEPKPSTADHASAHMPTSAFPHLAPATTTTHQPSTAAAEPQIAAQGDNKAPSNIPTQQGLPPLPIASLVPAQGPLTDSQPLQQASYLAQQKAPLQHDPTVQTSAACQEADLVLTEGAYECLTATGMTPSYRRNWEIPFTVQRKLRQVSADPEAPSDFERHKQQVLMDVPLPKRLLNLREKHEMLYQHAVCQMGCSLFSQLQQEAAAEAGVAVGNVEPQQQEAVDQMFTDDDQMRPHWLSEDQPGIMPYSPSQDAPYSPSNDANLVHSMTGLTENSSLMPSQPLQPAAGAPSEPEPIPAHPQHDLSTSEAALPGASSFAQAAAPQGGSVAQEEHQRATAQPASQIGNPAQHGDQLRTATGCASPADPLPAALPAAASASLWSAMDIDGSDALDDHAADDAQYAAPQGDAVSRHGQGSAAATEATVDASNLPGSRAKDDEACIADKAQHGKAGKADNGQHGEAGKADSAQLGEAGTADDAQHGKAGKADSAQHGEAGLSYSSYRLGGYSVVTRAQTPLTVPPRPLGEVTLCNLMISWAPSVK